MATMTPADATLQVRTFRRSPLSRARGHVGALWRRPLTQAIAKAVLTIYVTSTITFFLIRLMPGSPVELKIDELMQNGQMSYADAAAAASGLFDIDLNAPVGQQYLEYLANLARADLGNSFLSQGTSVTSIVLAVLPWTLFAVGTGLLLSFVSGIGLGLVAAYRRNSPLDHVVSTAGSVISSVPAYLIEQIFVYQGVGLRLVKAVDQRDYPVMQGIILMTTVAVIVANLVADLLYSRLDPRIGRAGGASGT